MGPLFVAGLHLAINKTIQVRCSKPKVIFECIGREHKHTGSCVQSRVKQKPVIGFYYVYSRLR